MTVRTSMHLEDTTKVSVSELSTGTYMAGFIFDQIITPTLTIFGTPEQLKDLAESILTQIDQLNSKKESVSA